jgi:hypothetical protein
VVGGATLSYWYALRPPTPSRGRQINKRVARASGIGALAYGATLGVGVATIVATPAVWIGLGVTLIIGRWEWGAVYGAAFGVGRSAMLMFDATRGRDVRRVTFQVIERQLKRKSSIRISGVIGGVAMLGLGVAIVVANWRGVW